MARANAPLCGQSAFQHSCCGLPIGDIMDTEDLILAEIRGVKLDVKEVHSRVSSLQKDTGEFMRVAEGRLATIEQIEVACPIGEVEATLREVEKTADQAKRDNLRTSAMIATGVGGIWAGLLAFFGWHQGGGN